MEAKEIWIQYRVTGQDLDLIVLSPQLWLYTHRVLENKNKEFSVL